MYTINDVTTIAVIVAVLMLVYMVGLRLTKGFGWLNYVFFIGYIGVIFYHTLLLRETGSELKYELELFWSYKDAMAGDRFMLYEILLNILLFVPFGFLMVHLPGSLKWWQVVLLCALTSAGVELAQLYYHLGLFEFDDIFDNTLGGIAGLICGYGSKLLAFLPKKETHF